MDPSKLSDDERKLLEEIAKSKRKTFDEVMDELYAKTAEEKDETVVFKASEPSIVVDKPEDKINPIEELPPPPAAAEEIKQATTPVEPVASPAQEEFTTTVPVCIHCGWDQQVPSVPEPESNEKLAFLHSILGLKPFTKVYPLMGGYLKVGFRTLNIHEIDFLYAETFEAQKKGVILSASDYYEYLNRLRLNLQLTSVTASRGALHVILPDGVNKTISPEATSWWEDTITDTSDSKSMAIKIQDYVLSNVLKTEQLHRIVTHACSQFNRLVAKLEACVDDSNFWQGIEQQS